MVAGIVHLVVPSARILSIKSFTNDGMGTVSAIVAGIYYAVDNGAQVINASWSATSASPEMQKALQYAFTNKVVVVAAVANDHSTELVYPAAYANTLGVACVESTGLRCVFSDYGSDVTIAAPGDGIVSTFPAKTGTSSTFISNGYATGHGTSFSTPYVTGTVALMRSLVKNMNSNQAAGALAAGALPVYSIGLGAGQLSVYGAAAHAH
jgi:subtilisin family serine protease